ncbi:MAG: DUF2252 domain-containing protein [Pseudomonadota bacterium]|nr:DUF2252 domain-containing protein [Pseudomonadota bacterium]
MSRSRLLTPSATVPRRRKARHPLDDIHATGAFLPGGLYHPELRRPLEPVAERIKLGQALRAHFPRESHAAWAVPAGRPDPLSLLAQSNRGRVNALVPLRMGRMASSAFAYLRGSACVMAWDLAQLPDTGLNVIIDGDAHIDNFGLFGTPEGEVVFDLNDFDETMVGPWIWDLKRLCASVNVAGRDNGFSRRERHATVMSCAAGYRRSIQRLAGESTLSVWYQHSLAAHFATEFGGDSKVRSIIRKAEDKARAQENHRLFEKVIEQDGGRMRFREDQPLLTRVDDAMREALIEALYGYVETVSRERAYMLRRYRVIDAAHRVVGVGSVGTRAWLVLLLGNNPDDPLFLQVKEAVKPAAAPYAPPLPRDFRHHGRRVVHGQRLLQAAGDPLMGWTTMDGRPYYVRQMRNMKGGIPTEWLAPGPLAFFSGGFAALLARGHARTGDAAVIAGYCGNSKVLDESLADWAELYGDQVEKDYQQLRTAVAAGKVKVEPRL